MLTNEVIRSPAMAKAIDASVTEEGRSRGSQGRVWVTKEFGGIWRLSTEASYHSVPVIQEPWTLIQRSFRQSFWP